LEPGGHLFCHPERSEGSHRQKVRSTAMANGDEVLRGAQDDSNIHEASKMLQPRKITL
jgi:hypothetical protein